MLPVLGAVNLKTELTLAAIIVNCLKEFNFADCDKSHAFVKILTLNFMVRADS